MRKIIAIGVLIALAVALYFYVGMVTKQTQVEKAYNENILSESVILYYLDTDYNKLVDKMHQLQVSPDQITRFNALITQILYSAELSESEIEKLVKLERMSYQEETLLLNPLDVQLERLTNELVLYKQYGNEGLKLIGYKVVGPEFETVDGEEYAIVNVLYYLSLTNVVVQGEDGEDGNLYVGYVLEQNDEGDWEIKGWGPVKEFLVVE